MTKETITPFQKLKRENRENRKSRLDRLIDLMEQQDYDNRTADRQDYPARKEIHYKVRDALVSIGNMELWYRIDRCYYNPYGQNYLGKGNTTTPLSKYDGICSSHYCIGCRNRMSLTNFRKLKDRIEDGRWITRFTVSEEPEEKNDRGFYTDSDGNVRIRTANIGPKESTENTGFRNKDFQQINAVLGICPARKDDLQKLLKEDNARWRRINRRLQKETKELYWIETTYELELVNWKHLKNAPESDYKKEQVRFLINATGERYRNEPFIYCHFHGITNLPKAAIHRVFGKEYFFNGKRVPKTNPYSGMYIQSLHSTQDLQENIRKIASYPFKNAVRYKHSFKGSDFRSGEPMLNEELGRLITINRDLFGRQGRSMYRSFSNDLNFWIKVEERLWDLIRIFRTMSFDGRKRWYLGVRYNPSEIEKELKKFAKLIQQVRTKKGNVSKKNLTATLRDTDLIKQIKDQSQFYWKLTIPFPKRWNPDRIYDGIWRQKQPTPISSTPNKTQRTLIDFLV